MKLLIVDCCISCRGEQSRTRRLLQTFTEAFCEKHPDAQLERVELETLSLPSYDQHLLAKRNALHDAGAFDDPLYTLARQFRDADEIVVAAPFWDLSYPAMLRTYIEHISAVGVTYHYDETGCHGDCRAQRLTYLTTGGDVAQPDSVGVLHWKQLTRMFGIPQFGSVFADGLDAFPEQTEERMQAAVAEVRRWT